MESTHNELAKQELRCSMSRMRDSIVLEKRKAAGKAASGHLIHWLKQRNSTSVMIYIALRSELELTEVMQWSWDNGIKVIAPRSIVADHSLELYEINSLGQLKTGTYGIMEPDPAVSRMLSLSESPDVVVAPGIAFASNGGRLGYGGGYYDRFAQKLWQSGKAAGTIWVGAAYEQQLVDRLPTDKHDQFMDWLVTENGMKSVIMKK